MKKKKHTVPEIVIPVGYDIAEEEIERERKKKQNSSGDGNGSDGETK